MKYLPRELRTSWDFCGGELDSEDFLDRNSEEKCGLDS